MEPKIKYHCKPFLKKLQKEIYATNAYVKQKNRGNNRDKTASYKMRQQLKDLANASTAANLLQSGLLSKMVAKDAQQRIQKEEKRLWQN